MPVAVHVLVNRGCAKVSCLMNLATAVTDAGAIRGWQSRRSASGRANPAMATWASPHEHFTAAGYGRSIMIANADAAGRQHSRQNLTVNSI
jgi:hypothetical protein